MAIADTIDILKNKLEEENVKSAKTQIDTVWTKKGKARIYIVMEIK